MTMKMRLKIKTRSHRYDINRPRPIYGNKCTKYKICLSIIMMIYRGGSRTAATVLDPPLICIKQHPSNI